MKTPKAIEVIQEYQKWLKEPPELTENGIYVDYGMPNRELLDKALSKAVEVMQSQYIQELAEEKLGKNKKGIDPYYNDVIDEFLDEM